MLKKLNKKAHLMPVPVGFGLDDILNSIILTVPFLIVYFWHIWHDHKHNDKLIKKMDEIIGLLKKLDRRNGKDE